MLLKIFFFIFLGNFEIMLGGYIFVKRLLDVEVKFLYNLIIEVKDEG